eukprot:scaffold1669_cov108-Isochrysis_galbana.AAC.5
MAPSAATAVPGSRCEPRPRDGQPHAKSQPGTERPGLVASTRSPASAHLSTTRRLNRPPRWAWPHWSWGTRPCDRRATVWMTGMRFRTAARSGRIRRRPEVSCGTVPAASCLPAPRAAAP